MKPAAKTSLQAEGPFKPKWTSHLSDVECYQVEDLASLERENSRAGCPWRRELGCCSAQLPRAEPRPRFSLNTTYKSLQESPHVDKEGTQPGLRTSHVSQICITCSSVLLQHFIASKIPVLKSFFEDRQERCSFKNWSGLRVAHCCLPLSLGLQNCLVAG